MIPIVSDRQTALLAMQLASAKLVAGDNIQARVIGPNRHGVAIQIGQETLQLDAPSSLGKAKTLTLQGAGSSSTSGIQVKIVEKDNRLLSRPIVAELTVPTKPSLPAAGAVVQTNPIKVIAQPLGLDGQVQGPRVTLGLQALQTNPTSPAETSAEKTAGRPPLLAAKGSTDIPDVAARTPVARGDQLRSTTSVADQLSASSNQGRGPVTDEAKALPVQNVSTKGRAASQENQYRPMTSTVMEASPLKSPIPTREAASETRRQGGDVFVQRPSPAMTVQSDGDPPVPTKTSPTLAASTYRGVSDAALLSKFEATPQTELSNIQRGTVSHLEPTTAIVIGRTSTDKIILKIDDHFFRVEQSVDLPDGMQLQAAITAGAQPPTMQPAPGVNDGLATSLVKLIALLDGIDQANRQAAEVDQPAPAKQLPAPDKHLASRFLGLMSGESDAPSPEDPRSSPDKKGMAIGQRDQIQTLVRELGGLASEPLADGWKGLTLPLEADQNQAVSLYFRDQHLDPDDESSHENKERAETKRAVFDVSFTRLGRCQIDALCQEKRFDLIVRNENPLPDEDRQHITALFVSALEIAGMHGDIAFNVGNFYEAERFIVTGQDLSA